MKKQTIATTIALLVIGAGIGSAALSLRLPEKTSSGETLTSQDWNTMIDALSGLQNEVNRLQTILDDKANKSDIPSSPDLSAYALTTDVDNKIKSVGGSLPNGWPKAIHCGEKSGNWVNVLYYSGDFEPYDGRQWIRYVSGWTASHYVDISKSSNTVVNSMFTSGPCSVKSSWSGITKIY